MVLLKIKVMHSKVECLSKQVCMLLTIEKAGAHEICQFSINYESGMFYSIGTKCWNKI